MRLDLPGALQTLCWLGLRWARLEPSNNWQKSCAWHCLLPSAQPFPSSYDIFHPWRISDCIYSARCARLAPICGFPINPFQLGTGNLRKAAGPFCQEAGKCLFSGAHKEEGGRVRSHGKSLTRSSVFLFMTVSCSATSHIKPVLKCNCWEGTGPLQAVFQLRHKRERVRITITVSAEWLWESVRLWLHFNSKRCAVYRSIAWESWADFKEEMAAFCGRVCFWNSKSLPLTFFSNNAQEASLLGE